MSVILGLCLFGLACFGGGWLRGLHIGVQDTERRWSDAVKRADEWRAEEAARLDRASSKGDDK